MNDDDLQRQLRQLRTPEASESTRARARHRALIAFPQGGSGQPQTSGQGSLIWSWRGAAAAAVLMGILPFLFLSHPGAPENLATDREILRQMETLFPHQVDAVVQNNGKTDLSIAQAPVVGSDQPVLVLFKRGHDIIRILSFSGHRVCVDLGKTHDCFEILESPTGGVILEAEDGVWLASQHPVIAGYAVRAQTLEASL
jgi:hypothetical protein